MKLKTILTAIILFQVLALVAQVKDTTQTKSKFWKDVHFGGGIQLGISNAQTTVGVSPSAIYNFSDKFAAGVSVSYLYSKLKYSDINYNIWGGSALALYNPIKALQLSTEFEQQNVILKIGDQTDSYWVPALYGGLAYRMGKYSSMGVRYDFLFEKDKSIYDSAFTPFVRLYF
jgi:hypothetical protein